MQEVCSSSAASCHAFPVKPWPQLTSLHCTHLCPSPPPTVLHPHFHPAPHWSPTLPFTLHLFITAASPITHLFPVTPLHPASFHNSLFALHPPVHCPSLHPAPVHYSSFTRPPHLPPALPFTLHLSVTAPSPFAYQSHALPSPCTPTWHDGDAACKVWGLEELMRDLVRSLRSAAPDLRQGAA